LQTDGQPTSSDTNMTSVLVVSRMYRAVTVNDA